ncbi:MAG TPA: hypothetical protein VMH84_03935 [Xanthobacteraceae bacterium]|nr:hypothetical protein [Xanthobacteraceae bacterium]
MSTAKRIALIAAGYALSIAGGLAAVAVNELRIPDEIKETSGGMVAFGDMVLFMLAAGFLSLVPTCFLLRLFIEKAPRTLLAIELLIAAIGPVSWLAVIYLAGGASPPNQPPQTVSVLLGLFVAFAAIPRMVLGPVLLVIEGATFLLIRARVARALLATAMLMDLIPLSMFALHMTRALPY